MAATDSRRMASVLASPWHEISYSEDLADRCIAHERRTKVRRAYQRGDLLATRRPIMQGWSDHITKSKSPE
jgi:hypothetical protein